MRSYLDKLTDALVVRQLKPWRENLGKQVQAPKIYVRDSGLLHAPGRLLEQRSRPSRSFVVDPRSSNPCKTETPS